MKLMKYKRKYEVCDINKIEPFSAKINFSYFCKKNFALFLILTLILVIIISICWVFIGESENFSTTIISILTSTLIYLGTSMLTITQLFHSWQAQQIASFNRTILLDVQSLDIAEKQLLTVTENATCIIVNTNNDTKQHIIFKNNYYNKTNFKIIDFDSLYFISMDKNILDVENLHLSTTTTIAELDNEYKNFDCEYQIPKKKFKQLINNSCKNFIILSTFADEFYENYIILDCFKLKENNSFILSSHILKRSEFYKIYGKKFNKKFTRAINKKFLSDD